MRRLTFILLLLAICAAVMPAQVTTDYLINTWPAYYMATIPPCVNMDYLAPGHGECFFSGEILDSSLYAYWFCGCGVVTAAGGDSDDVDQSFRSDADQSGAKRRRAFSV